MRWKVAEAKQKFSQILRTAQTAPQLIFNRDRLVAAVVDAETFGAFEMWQKSQQARSLADAFAELRAICAEERYSLETSPRADRPNAFADSLDDLSV